MSFLNELAQWIMIVLVGWAPWAHYAVYIRRRSTNAGVGGQS